MCHKINRWICVRLCVSVQENASVCICVRTDLCACVHVYVRERGNAFFIMSVWLCVVFVVQ